VTLVDSAETTALAVAEALTSGSLRSISKANGGAARIFATDSPDRFARVGAVFLGRPIDAEAVELVDLRVL
jgi:glutamate racemase